ncbi:hypothetical protein EJ110_NYTH29288 [Nymphaea thermarum]|nr:hypothetical protein EJ110_NYTH29288 [Nymphaea thermarum]
MKITKFIYNHTSLLHMMRISFTNNCNQFYFAENDLPNLADTYNRLSRLAVTLSQNMQDTPVSALVISGGRVPNSFGGSRGRGTCHGVGRGRFQCSYCGKIGHLEDRCWDKHPHLRSNVSSRRGGGRIAISKGPSSSQATHSKATISMVESSTDPSISMSYSLNLSKDEYDRVLALRSASTSTSTSANAIVIDSTFFVGASIDDPSMTWMIDSGTSRHCCNQPQNFSSFVRFSTPQHVRLADGKLSLVLGSGDIYLPHLGTITHVLYAQFSVNLLSVKQLAVQWQHNY